MRKVITATVGASAAFLLLTSATSAQFERRGVEIERPELQRLAPPRPGGCPEPEAPRPRASSYCARPMMCATGQPPRRYEACAEWKLIR
jgi:hypothetical protein